MSLLDDVRSGLSEVPKTIPELCEQFGEKNEFKMMRCIALLEDEGIATIIDCYKGFRPDGCAFYLARYARRGESMIARLDSNHTYLITVGDVRKARAALENAPKEGEDGNL